MKTLLTLASLALSAGAMLAQPPAKNDSESNLKALARAVRIYRATHNGQNPPSLADLYYQGYIDRLANFVHPSSGALLKRTELAEKSDYTLDPLPGADGVVVREKKAFLEDGKVLAAFADGTVRSVPFAEPASAPPEAVAPADPAKPSSGTWWWIVAVAILVGAGAVCILLVKARRRQKA